MKKREYTSFHDVCLASLNRVIFYSIAYQDALIEKELYTLRNDKELISCLKEILINSKIKYDFDTNNVRFYL